MAQQDANDFNAEKFIRRNTVMTGLVDFSLLATAFVYMKKIVEAGPQTDYYNLLVALISLLIIILVAMLVMVFVLHGRNTKFPLKEVDKIVFLREKMAQFRFSFKEQQPGHRELQDYELLDGFSSGGQIAGVPVNKEEYTDKIIQHYRTTFPVGNQTDDADIWSELKKIATQFPIIKASNPNFIYNRNHTNRMNDAIIGLSAVVFALMIMIGSFSGEEVFKSYTN